MNFFGAEEEEKKPVYTGPTRYDSVYWVAVDRIEPNPYQPRKEFDETALKSLAESIRQYGVLQPLVVTRKDIEKHDGGIQSVYELIAGERRLRASRLIGLREVPVVIRVGEQSDKMKLELAIIENLQREDLNAIDRAKALKQLQEAFGLSNSEIGAKVGKSREYVSNSIRLLGLPEVIQQAVVDKEITEGHARALLMLIDRPQEQATLFKEILLKKTSVRVVEQLARRIATDRIRKHDKTPEMMDLEKSLTETLGTRVLIENRPKGGRVLIEFFSPEDLSHIVAALAAQQASQLEAQMIVEEASIPVSPDLLEAGSAPEENGADRVSETLAATDEQPVVTPQVSPEAGEPAHHHNTTQIANATPSEEELYSVRNFTV